MKKEKRVTIRLTEHRANQFEYLMDELGMSATELIEDAVSNFYVWHIDSKEREGELTLRLKKESDKKLKCASIEYEMSEAQIIEMLILLYLKVDEPFPLLVEAYKADLELTSIGTRYEKDNHLKDARALLTIIEKLKRDMDLFHDTGKMIIGILIDRVSEKLKLLEKETVDAE